jgi:HK97 family phage portal protein
VRRWAQRSVGAAVQTWVGLAGLPAPARLKAAALAFVMSFTGRMPGIRRTPRTRYDWAAQIDAGGSSIVMACVLWLCRTFPEAPLRVQTIASDGALAPADGHPLVQLLARPNPFYSGVLLWWGTLCDWTISGNSYWIKIRSGAGRPVQLWWVPSPMIEPKWPDDGSAFISHYEYKPDAGKVPIRLAFDDVVHFRYGLDPLNMRKGLSPVGSLLREIFTDEEASAYVATMLRNLGVPGAMISPGDDSEISQADAELIKAEYIQRFGGDNRGLPMVLPGRAKVDILGFSPQQMDVKALRRVPEERVTAIFGTPAVVVGLGAGLDRSTFANFAEAREAAYESNVIPTQRLMSEELSTQLLPDFADPARTVLDFDLSKVRVLQPDQDKLHARARENLKAGLLSLNQSREMIGQEALKQGDVYYIPINVTPTSPEELILAPPISTRVTEQTPAVGDGTAAPADQAPPAGGKLRRLPRGRKSADGLARSIERARRRLDAATRRAVQGVLDAERARVLAHLGAKAADPLDLDTEETALRAVLDPQYKRLLEQILSLTADALGISFELDDPATRAYLAAAGTNIRGITETTLQAIRDALQAGQAEGEGVTQLAARIRDLAEFGSARAQTIARTELGQASNLAALASYRASGVVVGVLVLDGDYDPACAAADGTTLTLDEAAAYPKMEHPNCQRAFAPITDPAELENAA